MVVTPNEFRAVYFALFGNFCSGIVSDFSIFRKGFKTEKLFSLKIIFEKQKDKDKIQDQNSKHFSCCNFWKKGWKKLKFLTSFWLSSNQKCYNSAQNKWNKCGFSYKIPIIMRGWKLPKHYVKFTIFSSFACNVEGFLMSSG